MEASFGRPPAPSSLGYQDALNAGLAASSAGAAPLALSYFDRAVSLRRTAIALGQQGKCLRDLGRLDEALVALEEAMRAPGGDTRRARVTYIAALCDARRYEDALPLATQARADEPDNPAVLNVVARVLEEPADTLARGGVTPAGPLAAVRAQAQALRARARAIEAESDAERQQRRRERTFPLHSIAPPHAEVAIPVEQAASAVAWHLPPSDEEQARAAPAEAPRRGLLSRLWQRMRRKAPAA